MEKAEPDMEGEFPPSIEDVSKNRPPPMRPLHPVEGCLLAFFLFVASVMAFGICCTGVTIGMMGSVTKNEAAALLLGLVAGAVGVAVVLVTARYLYRIYRS